MKKIKEGPSPEPYVAVVENNLILSSVEELSENVMKQLIQLTSDRSHESFLVAGDDIFRIYEYFKNKKPNELFKISITKIK